MDYSSNVRLTNHSTAAIKDFIAANPISYHGKKEAQIIWKKKLPLIMKPFYEYVQREGKLPTQTQFTQIVLDYYHGWFRNECVDDYERKCVCCRVSRQFYPAGVDAIYCLALIGEHNAQLGFTGIKVDLTFDTKHKKDLLLERGNYTIAVGLRAPATEFGDKCAEHKRIYRPSNGEVIIVQLPARGTRPNHPGNKMWFVLQDFVDAGVIAKVQENKRFWNAQGELF